MNLIDLLIAMSTFQVIGHRSVLTKLPRILEGDSGRRCWHPDLSGKEAVDGFCRVSLVGRWLSAIINRVEIVAECCLVGAFLPVDPTYRYGTADKIRTPVPYSM